MNEQTILVVEDSPIQSEMLRRILVEKGYACRVAVDGRSGLDVLRRDGADLVISDISMPFIDGYEMCAQIKQDPVLRSIPVIVLTALSNTADVIRGLNAGAEAYLTKPYDKDRLLQQVQQLLDARPLPEHAGEIAEAIGLTLDGQAYEVTAGRQKILHMLISTYDNAVQQNRVLRKMEEDLRLFNQKLESRVKERTAALALEEARAREAELRYRTLFALLPEGVVLMAPDTGAFIESNAVACNQLGYSTTQFASLDLAGITAPAAREALHEHLQQAQLHEEYRFTTSHLTREGAPRDMEIRLRQIELGEQRLLHCIFRDVTELNRAQEMARELDRNAVRISELNREIQAMEAFSRRPLDPARVAQATLTAQVDSLVDRYINLLDLAVERQAYQVQIDISGALRTVADELGAVGAGPREVVALHGKSLRIKVDGLKQELKWAYMEEGRLMVLELMGYLADHYRRMPQ